MKILVTVLTVCLLLSGCANLATQATNVLNTTQQTLCNPTEEQKATAASVGTFLATGIALAGPFAGIAITKDQATALFSTVEAGLCVGATDLQQALAWFTAATSGTKAVTPTVKPLWAMLAKGK